MPERHPSPARRRRIPRSTLVPVLLLVYLAVMAVIGWPEYASGRSSALYYFGVIGATLAVIFLLHLNLKKREKMRAKAEKETALKQPGPSEKL